MDTKPFEIEVTLNAPAKKVWEAITEKDKMKEWYFDLKEFEAKPGFKFEFTGGTEERSYLHKCEVTEVVPEKKLTYSWRYDGYEGISYVTFELTPVNGKTKVKLTHAGLDSFPQDNPDFKKENFAKGWNEIIGKSLKKYVEKMERGC